jgi:3-methyladenine DNA glycosylase AlkD
VDELRSVADPSRRPGMARVGITIDRALGVSIPDCRRLARRHRDDHALALDLWTTRIHEARILASMVDDPSQVTVGQMEAWVVDFDSWDLCDQVCGNLFTETPHSFDRLADGCGATRSS